MQPNISEELNFYLFYTLSAPSVIDLGLNWNHFLVNEGVLTAFDLKGAYASSTEATKAADYLRLTHLYKVFSHTLLRLRLLH